MCRRMQDYVVCITHTHTHTHIVIIRKNIILLFLYFSHFFFPLWVVCWVAQEEEHSWNQTTLPSASTWWRSSPDNYRLRSRLWHHLVMLFLVSLFIPCFWKQRSLLWPCDQRGRQQLSHFVPCWCFQFYSEFLPSCFRTKPGLIRRPGWVTTPHGYQLFLHNLLRFLDSFFSFLLPTLLSYFISWYLFFLWIKVDQLDDTCFIIYCSTCFRR